MPLTPQRRERLLTLLSQEQSKTGKYSPSPAVFRETALDTHKAVPAEYWGAPAGATPPRRTSAPMQQRPSAGGGWQRAPGTLRRSASYVQRSTGAPGEPDYSDFRSVFKPTKEQEPVCQRSTQHRGNVAVSEWALLDTWQAQMFDDERRHKYQVLAGRQVDQRAALEKQLREQEQLKQAEQAQKVQEAQVLAQQVAEAKAIEQRKAEEAKASLVKIKREMDNMLTSTRAQKQAAAVARQQQELAELAAVQAALDADKVAAAAKMVNMKQQWQQTLAANEARIAARREAEAKQRERDNELLQETMRTLDAQEKAREEAQHAFHAMVAAKASRVGKVALEARREKEEKEELRIKQMHDIVEADAKQREAAAAAKKQAQKELMRKERADYLARQAEKLRAQQEDLARQRADAEERARLEREYEDHKMAMIRQRARSNADFVRTQALDREDRQVADDVFMTDAERQLNARLLEQATLRVGRPRQLTVKLC